MRDKRQLRIRDILLIQIIFFALLKFDSGIARTTGIYIEPETLSLITDILIIIICLRKIRLSKSRVNYLIKDFKDNIDIKEIIGRFLNSSVLNLGFALTIIGVFIFINIEVANDMLNTSSAQDMIHSGNIIINAISISIVAPIVEEIIYRKVLFKRLAEKTNTIIGLILSSLIFGLRHSTDSIVFATLLGVILCILYKKYENILVPMFLHFVNNLIATIFLLKPLLGESNKIITLTQQNAIIFLGVGIIASIMGIYFYIRYINKNKKYIKNIEKKAKELS